MRTTIACERCRKSKVKCHYDRQAPCRACLKSNNTSTCVLSGPVLSRGAGSKPGRDVSKRKSQQVESDKNLATKKAKTVPQDNDLSNLFRSISREEHAKALSVFQAQFSEFGFIHPSDYDWEEDKIGALQMIRLLATYAVASRYFNSASTPLARECASLVTRELQRQITSPLGIPLIQTYLITALYEWGEGEGFGAWMYAGIAARMVQGSLAVQTAMNGGKNLSELERRTIWTCFAMDKLLSCGKQRPAMFKLHEMNIPAPLGDEDFVYGVGSPATLLPAELGSIEQHTLSTGNYFQIIVEGLDIWSRIHSWIVEGGRKQPSMTESHNCPWQETSEWARMKVDLRVWRNRQEPRLRYPETKVAVHVHLRRGEIFGYINLIYYTSLLFLCREFIPFLPVGETVPRGPIDPPLLRNTAPEGFWLQNCKELFGAAAEISDIMKDLRNAGSPLHTPYTGLCAFTSTLMNLYAASFPAFVGPEISASATERTEDSMQNLTNVSDTWKLGEEWVAIIETAKSLFGRVTSKQAHTVRKSRYDYPELEDSFVMATLRGMPEQNHGQELPSSRETGLESDDGVDVTLETPIPPTSDSLDLSAVLGSEYMDEEDWRLWSFWDDPHLLSNLNGSELDRGAL